MTVFAYETGSTGHWEIYINPHGYDPINVTYFRGVATSVDSISTTDPFGPAAANITFQAITLLDTPGMGDLYWLIPECNVDIQWVEGYQSDGVTPFVKYVWEGYFASFDYGEEDAGGKLTVSCVGALKQLDNYVAKKEYLTQALPYEFAIYRQFFNKPDLRLAAPTWNKSIQGFDISDSDRALHDVACLLRSYGYTAEAVTDALTNIYGASASTVQRVMSASANGTTPILFPTWWDKRFNVSTYAGKSYTIPYGLEEGQLWSGLVTRDTGSFDSVLSNYIQGLLSSMHTDRGRFTLMLASGRKPVMLHRQIAYAPDNLTLTVDLLWPGVTMSASRDFSQKTNVVYGEGKSSTGNSFSNMQVSPDGKHTSYVPYAYRNEVYPATPGNPWWNPSIMRKESKLSFFQGVNAASATEIARKHLKTFSDPGITGQITLKTDPLQNGKVFARQRIVAGMSILVKRLFGSEDGIMFHITECNISSDGTVSLTLDSKYRDQLTVQEVRQRGKDALNPVRMMGSFDNAPMIDDVLRPWSYETGSGYVPFASYEIWKQATSASGFQDIASIYDQTNSQFVDYSKNLIPSNDLMDTTYAFPWNAVAKKFPPKMFKNTDSSPYIKVTAANTANPNDNWSVGYPVILSAKGDIKLFQMAAFDADGNIARVPFHVSFWSSSFTVGVSYTITPRMTGVSQLASPYPPNKVGISTIAISNNLLTINTADKHNLSAGTAFALTGIYNVKDGSNNYINDLIMNSSWAVVTVLSDTSFTAKVPVGEVINSDGTAKFDGFGVLPDAASVALSSTRAFVIDSDSRYYPFARGAWQRYNQDGTIDDTQDREPTGPLMVAYGNEYEKAGYWPFNSSDSQPQPPNSLTQTINSDYAPTGLYADESGFSWDFLGGDSSRVSQLAAYNEDVSKNTLSQITCVVMVYCDQIWDDNQGKLIPLNKDVYFLGRLYRKEPG